MGEAWPYLNHIDALKTLLRLQESLEEAYVECKVDSDVKSRAITQLQDQVARMEAANVTVSSRPSSGGDSSKWKQSDGNTRDEATQTSPLDCDVLHPLHQCQIPCDGRRVADPGQHSLVPVREECMAVNEGTVLCDASPRPQQGLQAVESENHHVPAQLDNELQRYQSGSDSISSRSSKLRQQFLILGSPAGDPARVGRTLDQARRTIARQELELDSLEGRYRSQLDQLRCQCEQQSVEAGELALVLQSLEHQVRSGVEDKARILGQLEQSRRRVIELELEVSGLAARNFELDGGSGREAHGVRHKMPGQRRKTRSPDHYETTTAYTAEAFEQLRRQTALEKARREAAESRLQDKEEERLVMQTELFAVMDRCEELKRIFVDKSHHHNL